MTVHSESHETVAETITSFQTVVSGSTDPACSCIRITKQLIDHRQHQRAALFEHGSVCIIICSRGTTVFLHCASLRKEQYQTWSTQCALLIHHYRSTPSTTTVLCSHPYISTENNHVQYGKMTVSFLYFSLFLLIDFQSYRQNFLMIMIHHPEPFVIDGVV